MKAITLQELYKNCLRYGFTQVIIDQLGSSQCSGIYRGRMTTKTIELNPNRKRLREFKIVHPT